MTDFKVNPDLNTLIGFSYAMSIILAAIAVVVVIVLRVKNGSALD